MYLLIRKDVILSRRIVFYTYLFYAPLAALFFVQSDAPTASMVLTAVMFAFVPIVALGREDKFNAGAFNCCLPVTRSQIVVSRYLYTILLGAFGLLLMVVVFGLCGLARGGELMPFRPGALLLAIALTGLLHAAVLPALLRYGILAIFIVVTGLNVLGIVALMLVQLLPGRHGIAFLFDMISTGGALVISGDLVASVVTLAALAVVAAGSVMLALWLYPGREY